MASNSNKKVQRKRKSAGLGDIFEISDRDLSPEPEKNDIDEPANKLLKTRDSDVSELRTNSEQHNLNDEIHNTTQSGIITEEQDNTDCKEKIDCIDISDNSVSEVDDVQIIEDSMELSKESANGDKCCSAITDVKSREETITIIPSNILTVEDGTVQDTSTETLTDVPENDSEVALTILDDDDDSIKDDVCDTSTCVNKEVISLINPQILCENTLEDGELNENTSEGLVASVPTENPAITIKFSHQSMADMYKLKFCKFIQSFDELEVRDVDDMTIRIFRDDNINSKDVGDTVSRICQEEELAKLLPITPKAQNVKKKKKKKKQETQLFVVDSNPGTEGHKSVLTKYSTKFLINDKKQEEDKNEKSKPSFSNVCFNCSKEHSLKDCPLPKNFARISGNRQKYQSKNKSSRYHLEEDHKYGHLKPGLISPSLRKALGLMKHQLPSYIYQMRSLGYPPGWLEEAKFVSSELTMFDLDGNNVKDTSSRKNKGLDPEKVVEYPGFNSSFEKQFKDEYKHYRVPAFCDKFSKESMILNFKQCFHGEEDDFETQDMDLDNTNDSVDDDVVADKLQIETKRIESSVDSDSNNELSISLKELQKQKDSLLEEIKKSGETIPWEQPSGDTNQSLNECGSNEEKSNRNEDSDGEIIDEKRVKIKTAEGIPEAKESKPTEINDDYSPLKTPSNVNCVKHSVFGTPILKSSSPYNRLPEADNFTKGVSPVIDFENLPNSTGKYEQMTGVLQKVRSALKNLQQPKT